MKETETMKIPLSKIKASRYQVRAVAEDGRLQDLGESIKEHGLLQPIKVRPVGDRFELVYGHRRLAAMRLLRWKECEAIVEEIGEQESQLQGIIENLQREDLNPKERADSYQKLQQEFDLDAKQIAKMLGVAEETVRRHLDLLELPEEVQEKVSVGRFGPAAVRGAVTLEHISSMGSVRNEPKVLRPFVEKIEREGLTVDAVREVRKALATAPDDAAKAEVLATPFTRTADEIRRELLVQKFEREADRRGERVIEPQEVADVILQAVAPVSDALGNLERFLDDETALQSISRQDREAMARYLDLAASRLARSIELIRANGRVRLLQEAKHGKDNK